MDRLPGEPGESTAAPNNSTATCEHFCSPAHPRGQGSHTQWLRKILQLKKDLTRTVTKRGVPETKFEPGFKQDTFVQALILSAMKSCLHSLELNLSRDQEFQLLKQATKQKNPFSFSLRLTIALDDKIFKLFKIPLPFLGTASPSHLELRLMELYCSIVFSTFSYNISILPFTRETHRQRRRVQVQLKPPCFCCAGTFHYL